MLPILRWGWTRNPWEKIIFQFYVQASVVFLLLLLFVCLGKRNNKS